MPTLSPESIAATQHVMDLMRPSALIPTQKFLRLDLSDPLQHRFFMDRFGAIEGNPLGPQFPSRAELAAHLARPHVAAVAPARPMLHALRAAPQGATYVPVGIIAAFNYDNSGPSYSTVTAGGIISIPGGFVLADASMELYDGSGTAGQPVATGAATAYGAYMTAANATGTLTTAGDQATALFSGHYTDAQKQTVPFAVSQTIGPQPAITIAVSNPVHTVTTKGNPMTVAIGRYSPAPAPQDTDYSFNIGIPGYRELLLSVSGTATTQSPSFTFTSGQTVGGSLVLLKQSGAAPGGATVLYPGSVGAACSVNGQLLTWNFNTGPFGGTDFGTIPQPPWLPGDTILMTLNLMATLNGPSGQTSATLVVTSDQSGTLSGQQMGNTYFIDALMFYWGCVAADARVQMADGGEKAIRDIQIGEHVAGLEGRVWHVASVKTGAEHKPMLEIETEFGDTVLVTDGHPIITSAGPRVARALDVGHRIVTHSGEATIVRIDRVMYSDAIFNLVLANEDGSCPDEASFYAGGILVGDDRMQAAVERSTASASARAELSALASAASNWRLQDEAHLLKHEAFPLASTRVG